MPSAGKRTTGAKRAKSTTSAKRGKTYNQCQAREKVQPVGTNRCRAVGNVKLVPSAGKRTGAKRGKRYSRCQERENVQPVPSAGKHATGAQREKIAGVCSTTLSIN